MDEVRKLYAIGDVHGCFDALMNVLEQIGLDKGDDPSTIVFLGDYVDRGPDSQRVVDTLIKLQTYSRLGERKTNYVFLKGNHEEMMLGGIHADSWMMNGGYETLASYEKIGKETFDAHKDWMTNNLDVFTRIGPYAFVHAGLNPLASLANQDAGDMIWDRTYNSWNGVFPENLFVVHGHTPVTEPDLKQWQLNIDTGCVFGRDYAKYGNLTAVRLPENPATRDFKFFQAKQFPKWA